MTSAPSKGRLAVRVRLLDTWDELEFDVPPTETVAAIKAKALGSCRLRSPAAEYEVKLGGALVRDESRSIADAGAKDGSTFIVLPRRRRPVR